MEQASAFKRMGLYVVSTDMERSEAFYTAVFGQPAEVKFPGFIGFGIAGGLFAVVDRDTFAPQARTGQNVVPYLSVGDIRQAFEHVEAAAPGAILPPGLIEEEAISLFKVADPDGNVLEYYALAAR